jgi:predicted RecB family nuclease
MIGAWWCDAGAERMGVTMPQIELMAETGRYNEVDCRSMAEVLGWLRQNR